MSSTRTPLDPARDEEIAAFIDATLDPKQRDALAARLACDPDARLVLVESARFVHEEPGEGRRPADAAPHAAAPAPPPQSAHPVAERRSRLPIWAGALAASVILALTLRPAPPASFDADWAAALATTAGAPPLLTGHSREGANVFSFAPNDGPESRSFRLGVASVDIAIVLRSGEDGAALDGILDGTSVVTESQRQAIAAIRRLTPPSQRGERLSDLERALASSAADRRHFELGRWVEGSRIAAATGDVHFFRRPAFQQALRQARGQGWGDETRAGIEQAASAGTAEPPDLERLEASFDQILRLY